jgi:uncharacterized protein YjdB
VDTIVNEYINVIQGANLSKALGSSGLLTSSDVTYLRATIINKIKADQLFYSGNVDQILPSMMKGVTQGARLLGLGSLSGDTRALANIIGIATSSSVQSALARPTQMTPGYNITAADIVGTVVQAGVAGLQATVPNDPVSLKAALSNSIQTIATQATILGSTNFTAKDAVEASVNATVQVAAAGGSASSTQVLLQAAFSGAAQALTSATSTSANNATLQEVMSKAIEAAAVVDPTVVDNLMTQAAVGLEEGMTVSGASTASLGTVLTSAATSSAATLGLTIDTSTTSAFSQTLLETIPTATLVLASPTVTNNTLPYAADGTSVTLNWTAAGSSTLGWTATLSSPTDISTAVVTASSPGSGSWTGTLKAGSHTFLLVVQNSGGYKTATKQLVVRMAAPAVEKAPTAVLTAKVAGTSAPIASSLAYTAGGYDLILDSTGSLDGTGGTNFTASVISSGTTQPTASATPGQWTFHVAPNTTTVFTLTVKNTAGVQSTSTSQTVTVLAAAGTQVVHPTTLGLTPSTLTLAVGNAPVPLVASLLPTTSTNLALTWTTSNAAVAVVDPNGVVTAKGAGTAIITVKPVDNTNNLSKTATVTVLSANQVIKVTGVTLDLPSVNLSPNSNPVTLHATVLPDNATNKLVTWTSSDPTVAVVDDFGVVTPMGIGTAVVTVRTKDQNKTALSVIQVQSGGIDIGVSPPTEETLSVQGPGGFWQTAPDKTYTATFSGTATSYTWYLDGYPILGANDTQVTLTPSAMAMGTHLLAVFVGDNVGVTYSGTIPIVVYGKDGVIDGTVKLDATPPEVGIIHFVSATTYQGTYSGTPGSAYQWYVNGQPVQGATAPKFSWPASTNDVLIGLFVTDAATGVQYSNTFFVKAP